MDENKLHEFMGKLVSDMGGAAMMASVIVGEEVGFYRAMGDGMPVTADELASRTGCNPRLTNEWLNAQAASGYVEYADERFRLPPEQAMAFAHEDSPVYVAGGMTVLASMFLDKNKIVQAIRGRRCSGMGGSPSLHVFRHRAFFSAGLSRQPCGYLVARA